MNILSYKVSTIRGQGHSEFNGSVAALYSATGTELGSYRYSPYGQTTATGTAAEANPFRYIGGHQDKNNNGDDSYYKLGARYYDAHGHFTQPDAIAGSIADPKTMTAYNYAGGDPINSSDPSGYSFRCDVASGAGALGGAFLGGAIGFVAGGPVGAGIGVAVGGGAVGGYAKGACESDASSSGGILKDGLYSGGIGALLAGPGLAAGAVFGMMN